MYVATLIAMLAVVLRLYNQDKLALYLIASSLIVAFMYWLPRLIILILEAQIRRVVEKETTERFEEIKKKGDDK